jgi:PglD N-terminal domain
MRASSSSKPVAPRSSASRAAVVRGGSSARAFQESDPLNASDMTVNYFTSYAFAHIYAFADWFSWYTGGEYSQVYARYDLSYGYFTFTPYLTSRGIPTTCRMVSMTSSSAMKSCPDDNRSTCQPHRWRTCETGACHLGSEHALVVADIIRLVNTYQIIGMIDEMKPERAGSEFAGYEVLGGRESLDSLCGRGKYGR